MMREINVNDDDTDSSIKSDDILPSSYPVKPRKNPRRDRTLASQSYASTESYDVHAGGSASSVDADIDEKLRYINSIETGKPEIAQMESIREENEIEYKSLMDAIAKISREVSSDKKLQENHFKVMQSLHIRVLQLRSMYLQRNEVLIDAHAALTRRREAVENIRAQSSLPYSPDTVSVMRVNLSPSGRILAFYKGQYIQTPMGEGKVLALQPAAQKIEIQLNFGVLYASVATVVGWSSTASAGGLDTLSDEYLVHKWSARQGAYNAPLDYHHRLRTLLLLLEGDDDGGTDNDDIGDDPTEDPAGDAPLPGVEVAAGSDEIESSSSSSGALGTRDYVLNQPLHAVGDDALQYVFGPPGTPPLTAPPLARTTPCHIPHVAALPYMVETLERAGSPRPHFSRESAPEALALLDDALELREMQEYVQHSTARCNWCLFVHHSLFGVHPVGLSRWR